MVDRSINYLACAQRTKQYICCLYVFVMTHRTILPKIMLVNMSLIILKTQVSEPCTMTVTSPTLVHSDPHPFIHVHRSRCYPHTQCHTFTEAGATATLSHTNAICSHFIPQLYHMLTAADSLTLIHTCCLIHT